MHHRHSINGGGLVTGQADVSVAAFLDRESLASEHCSIDSAHVSKSLICADTVVASSTIINSLVSCLRVTNSFVLDSNLKGRVAVRNSHIECASLAGSIIAEGHISGFQLECQHPKDFLYLHGVWTRPPKFILLENFVLSECQLINGVQHINIGCSCKPVTYWLNLHSRVRMGKRLGADSAIITDFIQSLIAVKV